MSFSSYPVVVSQPSFYLHLEQTFLSRGPRSGLEASCDPKVMKLSDQAHNTM